MVGAAWCAPAPEPGHEIAPTRTAIIPMRDGVGLATDIYLPTADARRLPTILIQTPYGKGNYNREWGLRAGALPHRKIYQVER
jgi:predicted acyl esterase